jgi:hypothetical protein
MQGFNKLAAFFDSVSEGDPNYDYVCYIKEKIAEDLSDPLSINNGEDAELDNPDMTVATPEQQTEDNAEGELMHEAFQELEALNQIEKEKEKINVPTNTMAQANPTDFGNSALQQKAAEIISSPVSLYDVLRTRFVKTSSQSIKTTQKGI